MPSFKPMIWFLIGYVCIGFEILVPQSILLWFGIGGILTCMAIYFDIIITALSQWIFFGIASIVLLTAWHTFFKSYFRNKKKQMN